MKTDTLKAFNEYKSETEIQSIVFLSSVLTRRHFRAFFCQFFIIILTFIVHVNVLSFSE